MAYFGSSVVSTTVHVTFPPFVLYPKGKYKNLGVSIDHEDYACQMQVQMYMSAQGSVVALQGMTGTAYNHSNVQKLTAHHHIHVGMQN